MADEMKPDAKTVKRLRTERAWSQEQLAQIADVSLRTIQRVEADGSASRETRMALAAAFGIDVRELAEAVAPMPAAPPPPLPSITATRPEQPRVLVAALPDQLKTGARATSGLNQGNNRGS